MNTSVKHIVRRICAILVVPLMGMSFCSCSDELYDVNDQVTGHWVVCEVSMHDLLSLDFDYDGFDYVAYVDNADWDHTPQFHNGEFEYRIVRDRSGDTVLHLTRTKYNLINEACETESYKYIFHQVDEDDIELTTPNSLFWSSKTFRFTRR